MSGRLGTWVLRRWPEALSATRWPGQQWPGARGVLRIAVVGLLVALAPASVAVADTDPAGTYLFGNQVFLSSQPVAVSPAQRRLLAVVREADQAGFQIRVAIVPSQYDLGSVPALWRKPQTYARFLETELAPSYRGRLLVVMPNGLGFSWPGWCRRRTTGRSECRCAPGPTGLRRPATLPSAGSRPLPALRSRRSRRLKGPARASSADLLPIVGASLGVLAALAALAIVLPRARRILRRAVRGGGWQVVPGSPADSGGRCPVRRCARSRWRHRSWFYTGAARRCRRVRPSRPRCSVGPLAGVLRLISSYAIRTGKRCRSLPTEPGR